MSSKFTVLIDVYWGFAFFQKALEGIQNQTYQNLEIIIANNGANDEITQFINKTKKTDSRIKVLHYEKNIYFTNDIMKFIVIISYKKRAKKIALFL